MPSLTQSIYSTGPYKIDEIFGFGAVSLRLRKFDFLSLFHHFLRYLGTLYIVWSLVRRRVTRRDASNSASHRASNYAQRY